MPGFNAFRGCPNTDPRRDPQGQANRHVVRTSYRGLAGIETNSAPARLRQRGGVDLTRRRMVVRDSFIRYALLLHHDTSSSLMRVRR